MPTICEVASNALTAATPGLISVNQNSTLQLDNNTSNVVANRLKGAALTFNGGALTFVANNNLGAVTSETVGAVKLGIMLITACSRSSADGSALRVRRAAARPDRRVREVDDRVPALLQASARGSGGDGLACADLAADHPERPLGDDPAYVDYDDYRDAGDGVKVPFLVQSYVMTQKTTTHVQKVQDNAPIDAGKFTKPAPKAAPAAGQ